MSLTYVVSLLEGIWKGDAWRAHVGDVAALVVVFIACTGALSKSVSLGVVKISRSAFETAPQMRIHANDKALMRKVRGLESIKQRTASVEIRSETEVKIVFAFRRNSCCQMENNIEFFVDEGRALVDERTDQ